MFTNLLEEAFQPDKVLAKLISNRFQEFDIILTPVQRELLLHQLQEESISSIHMEFTPEQIDKLKLRGYSPSDITLDFSNFELSDSKIDHILDEALSETLSRVSTTLLKAWKKQVSGLLKQQQEERSQFTSRIQDIWAKPLDLLEMLLSVSHQAGAEFNNHFRPAATQENDLIFESLTRLHARGCQVSFEILTLLKNGFADGAHARWRTLHEIAVTAMFIAKHGKDVAESYLYHSAVNDYHEATLYQQYHRVLGYAPVEQDVINRLKTSRDQVIQRFGDSFRHDYGWAANVLGLDRPRFVNIERDVELTHLRPFYKLANINVHAGSKSISFRLGSPPNRDDLLISGGSIYGLAEPGQNTALSIHHLTTTLLLTRPSLDHLAFVTTTQTLVDEVFWTFDELMETIIKEEDHSET